METWEALMVGSIPFWVFALIFGISSAELYAKARKRRANFIASMAFSGVALGLFLAGLWVATVN